MAAGALLLVSAITYLVLFVQGHHGLIDMQVYRAMGRNLRIGHNIYGPLKTPFHLRATYPPFAAMLFLPLSLVPLLVAKILVIGANLALVVVCCALSCRLVGIDEDRRPATALALSAVVIWAEPVYRTILLGQIDLALLALVLWDFVRPATARGRGIALGIAAAIKITPLILIVYLLLTRRFRMAAGALGTFVVALLIGESLLPNASRSYWTKLLFQVSRVGKVQAALNQSLRGLLARATHNPLTTVAMELLVAFVAVAGLAIAVFAYRRLDDAWGLLAAAVTGLLVSPISWSHHWVWCIPMVLLVWTRARIWSVVMLMFWTYFGERLPINADLHLSATRVALSSGYVVVGFVFLGLTAYRARRAPQLPEPDWVRSGAAEA